MTAPKPGADTIAPTWENIPTHLAERKQWLVWKLELKPGQAKLAKIPYYAKGTRRVGEQGSDRDRSSLVTLAKAREAFERGGYAGIGLALVPDDGLVGIDLDHVVTPTTGEMSEQAQAIVHACASYTEYSPSGTGLHIIVRGVTTTNKSNDIGVEVFCGRQYFTVTGRQVVDTPGDVTPVDRAVLKRLHATINRAKDKRKGEPAASRPLADHAADDFKRVNDTALRSLPSWVPDLLPAAKSKGDGYRITSRALNRPNQEDLSITPSGIVDFGLEGTGDPKDGRRTPIDLVMEWLPAAKPKDALLWLSKRLGLDLSTPKRKMTAAGEEFARQVADQAAPGAPNSKEDREGPAPLAPPTMAAEGFPELLRSVVEASCASSEAHPVAVAANVMGLFCCAVGRAPYQRIGDGKVHARPFPLVIGKSGKARKGTAELTPREVARRADAILRKRHQNEDRLRIHAGGLSTGEGVGYAIRDAREPDEKTGKGGDLGVNDKRLMVIESEFANVLAQAKREGNILSPTIRNLWDGRDIEPLTKTSQLTATRPHVVIIGHITGHELREKSTENDAANGLLNRFMMLHVHRPKLVPLPEPTPEPILCALAERLANAVDYATRGDPHGNNTHEIELGLEARELWCELYPQITRERDGKAGSLMARSEVYARMLAMVFCLMDQRSEIEPCDLRAAVAWVEYWHQSITYVFLTGEDESELDDFTKTVLELVLMSPGVKLSELQEHWNRKKTAEVKAALETLLNMALPPIEMRRDSSTGGRVAQRYYPVSA